MSDARVTASVLSKSFYRQENRRYDQQGSQYRRQNWRGTALTAMIWNIALNIVVIEVFD
jgi:hypothetical protein